MMRLKTLMMVMMILLMISRVDEAKAETPTRTPIKHFIVMMQENHTFDNYFGTYPGADGFPIGAKMPVDPDHPEAGYVKPWHLGTSTISDLSHNTATFIEQYNEGKMDGFVSALNNRNQDGKLAMGYYDDRDIPYYWNLADHYVLLDRFFSSAKDGSFSNHMYWVAGTTAIRSNDLVTGLAGVPTIFDRLESAEISWKFYIQNYDPTITYRNLGTAGNRASQVVWVPLLNVDRFLDDPKLSSHLVDLNQYFEDLRSGNLPAVAYIVPSGASEHPPQYPATGMRFVRNLIQELMRSEYWDSSAFLLLYDDWGGWYDHVPPPQVDEFGYGPRVPALLVSSYAREGYIESTELDFTSCLKFIEYNWNISPLANRDAQANNFLTAFDFEQIPRQAEFLPLEREQAPALKKTPTYVIYLAYGTALITSSVTFGFAFFRRQTLKQTHVEKTINA